MKSSVQYETAPVQSTGANGVWLRHCRKDGMGNAEADIFLDGVEVRLEEVVAEVANILRSRHRTTPAKAQKDAANLVMSAMLSVQSRYAPHGLVAMVHALVEHDPSLASLREDFRTTVWREGRRLALHFTAGVFFASGLLIALGAAAAATLFLF